MLLPVAFVRLRVEVDSSGAVELQRGSGDTGISVGVAADSEEAGVLVGAEGVSSGRQGQRDGSLGGGDVVGLIGASSTGDDLVHAVTFVAGTVVVQSGGAEDPVQSAVEAAEVVWVTAGVLHGLVCALGSN